jgi:integrase/recombinase XerD
VDEVIRAQLGPSHPLARALDEFLIDLGNGNASPHTIRAYRGDLLVFAAL